ncbi:MAG: ATP-binding protein [Opitutus sp.]|nr:ATP-binding protein [Opitutus sp.]
MTCSGEHVKPLARPNQAGPGSATSKNTGRGIPADERAAVVEFGRRASNVGNVRTMGGGFGLTKAFLATKQFGGRFWIATEVGVGTRVRIHVPRPVAAQTR